MHGCLGLLGYCSICPRNAIASGVMGIWHMRGLGSALALVLLSGCASPGPPQAPSLKLPEVVTGLTASRVGNEVQLHWITPTRTTDKLLIAGPVEAEICRETGGAISTSARVDQNAVHVPCSPVLLRVPVKPGASDAVDALPVELTTAPARLLAYRVQLRNGAGRTAGASAAVFAASGPAPMAIEELRARATKAGAVVEWKAAAGEAETVELDRTIMQPATASTTATSAASTRKVDLLGAVKEPTELRLRVGDAASSAVNAGGTVGRTAQIGHAYRYTAQRVHSLELGGQTLELRSAVSADVPVEMKDIFPPEAPVGLVSAPGFASDSTQKPAIDLSWEPNMEPHVAGYRVYRHDLGGEAASAWKPLDSELVPVAAYSDLTVMAGYKYGYRVTAVDSAGNESARSDEVVETAPGP